MAAEELAAMGMGGGEKPPGPVAPEVESEDEGGEEAAISAFAAAVKKGDMAAAKSEFKTAVEACVSRLMKEGY
jgi:hypothetical protein